MGFEPDRNESAVKFKERIAVAEAADLLAVIPVMRKKIYFAAQFPFLLEELARRGHPIKEAEPSEPRRMPMASIAIVTALALVTLFFDGHIWLRDMIHSDLVKFHIIKSDVPSQQAG